MDLLLIPMRDMNTCYSTHVVRPWHVCMAHMRAWHTIWARPVGALGLS